MAYSREWLEERGSEDSHGRAVWALGAVVGRSRGPGLKSPRRSTCSMPRCLRSWSSTAPGLGLSRSSVSTSTCACFRERAESRVLQKRLSERLLSRFQTNIGGDWPWCEDVRRLRQPAPAAGPDRLGAPNRAIERWSRRGSSPCNGSTRSSARRKAISPRSARTGSTHEVPRGLRFDQQPLEAGATVSACLDAWRVTGDEQWAREMWRGFSWFLGENQLQSPLYDPTTGGCRDGLHPDRPNREPGSRVDALVPARAPRHGRARLRDATARRERTRRACRRRPPGLRRDIAFTRRSRPRSGWRCSPRSPGAFLPATMDRGSNSSLS